MTEASFYLASNCLCPVKVSVGKVPAVECSKKGGVGGGASHCPSIAPKKRPDPAALSLVTSEVFVLIRCRMRRIGETPRGPLSGGEHAVRKSDEEKEPPGTCPSSVESLPFLKENV